MDAYKLHKTPVLVVVAFYIFICCVVSGCSFNVHDDVYPAVSAKSRTITSVTITPGSGAEYAFTYDSQPAIEITSPIEGAVAFYSIDGGAYAQYTGAFTLPIADPKVNQTFTVTAYVTHPDYNDSTPVSQTYRFVATTVPTPTIQATPESTFFHFYYHFNNAPKISVTCSLTQATIWYSVDGGATYVKYTGPFNLPLPTDQTTIKTVAVSLYASETGYIDSAVSTLRCRFAPNGTIVTIAGTGGTSGFKDGAADSALFNEPYGLYVDAKKNVYVADCMNSRIRKITTDGSVSTIAGNGAQAYSGDNGPAVDASLWWPLNITMDEAKGILYIADTQNGCVRTVALSEGTIATYAGNPGSSPLNSPEAKALRDGAFRGVTGIAFHPAHGLVIADPGFYVLFNLSGTHIDRIAGTVNSQGDSSVGDIAKTCHFNNPRAVAWGSDGTLYIADGSSGTDRLYSINGGTIASVYSGLNAPFQIHPVDSGVYVAEVNACVISRITGSVRSVIAGSGYSGYSGDGGPATSARLKAPAGVFVIPGDGVYISDTENHCIRKVILY